MEVVSKENSGISTTFRKPAEKGFGESERHVGDVPPKRPELVEFPSDELNKAHLYHIQCPTSVYRVGKGKFQRGNFKDLPRLSASEEGVALNDQVITNLLEDLDSYSSYELEKIIKTGPVNYLRWILDKKSSLLQCLSRKTCDIIWSCHGDLTPWLELNDHQLLEQFRCVCFGGIINIGPKSPDIDNDFYEVFPGLMFNPDLCEHPELLERIKRLFPHVRPKFRFDRDYVSGPDALVPRVAEEGIKALMSNAELYDAINRYLSNYGKVWDQEEGEQDFFFSLIGSRQEEEWLWELKSASSMFWKQSDIAMAIIREPSVILNKPWVCEERMKPEKASESPF
jgi:hypothetical protein